MKTKWIFIGVVVLSLIGITINFYGSKNLTTIVAWGFLGIITMLGAIFVQLEKK